MLISTVTISLQVAFVSLRRLQEFIIDVEVDNENDLEKYWMTMVVKLLSPAIFVTVFLPLFIALYYQTEYKKILLKRIIKSKNKKENVQMLELAKRFIGKKCFFHTFNGSAIIGTIKEVSNTAVLIENKNVLEAVNLDFVVKIRECHR